MSAAGAASFRVAVAQPFCVPGDVEGNLARMEPLIERAGREGARLVVFSEGGVTGYEAAVRSVSRAVTLGDATCARLHAMAARHGAAIAAGFIERADGRHHITQGVFHPDGRLDVQRKYGMGPVESRIPGCTAGPEERMVFEIDDVRCAIAICADFGIKDLWARVAAQGVQLLILASAGCGQRAFGLSEAELDDSVKRAEWVRRSETVLSLAPCQALCREHRIALVSCNQMADDGVSCFQPGHSGIVDASGELLALIPGVCVFEHLRERIAVETIHPRRRAAGAASRGGS